MKRTSLWVFSLLLCVAGWLGFTKDTLHGKADAWGQLLLYPKEELAWLTPAASQPYACFLPGEPQQPEQDYTVAGEVQILIYHTHTTEAYRMDGADAYTESGFSRTKDNNQNVVRVGEALKAALEAKGYRVVHDTTDHEPPKLATSYSRSEETMRAYREKYPDLRLMIDLHRDAANLETQQQDVVSIDGKDCARLMFVVGQGVKYDEKPDFASNHGLAEQLCAVLDAYHPRFTRNIRVKSGRYNQHLSDMCLLLEVGHNANTLQHALNSMPYVAEAIAQVVPVVD